MIPSVTIINGDSLEVLKQTERNSVELIVTSPPYGNLRTYCDGYENGIYHELTVTVDQKWHPSLFEAVNIWSLTAKLLGAETPQGVANMAGDGPPNFNGRPGCSTYTDNLTGLIYYWDSSQWLPFTYDVPF